MRRLFVYKDSGPPGISTSLSEETDTGDRSRSHLSPPSPYRFFSSTQLLSGGLGCSLQACRCLAAITSILSGGRFIVPLLRISMTCTTLPLPTHFTDCRRV
ncbi:hypothetical protein AMECASPLE_026529 [Ameca splendens]|uniref:Uncharacterized protein n=1 Tax=Ameca splendens TaxID=208324 RepID=A0ABV0YRY2_9TELE